MVGTQGIPVQRDIIHASALEVIKIAEGAV